MFKIGLCLVSAAQFVSFRWLQSLNSWCFSVH
jgi:hypothetical protein